MFIELMKDVMYILQFIIVASLLFNIRHKFTVIRMSLTTVALVVASMTIYHINEISIQILLMIACIFVILCFLYEVKKSFLIIYTLGMVATFSVVNLMTDMIVLSLVGNVHNIANKSAVHSLCSLGISNLFLLVVGLIVRKNSGKGLNLMKLRYILLFSVVLLIDSMVVLGLGDIALNSFEKNNLYRFMYVLVVIGIFIQLAMVIWFMLSRDVYREKEAITQKYLDSQIEHYHYLEVRDRETKKFRHDIKYHMQMLAKLHEQRNYDVCKQYIETINGRIEQFGNRVHVNNGIVDAILNRYFDDAEGKGIQICVIGRFPEKCVVSAYDLCTIFSNLLSNALRAELESGGKEIKVECKYTKTEIVIAVENDYKKELKQENGRFRTSKEDIANHGFGLENVEECVARNRGYMDICMKQGRFRVLLTLENNLVGDTDYENWNSG